MNELEKFLKLNECHEKYADHGPFYADFYVNYEADSSDNSSCKSEDTCNGNPEKKSTKNQFSSNKQTSTQSQTENSKINGIITNSQQNLNESKKNNLISNESQQNLNESIKINESNFINNEVNEEDKINKKNYLNDNSNINHKKNKKIKNIQIDNEIENDTTKYSSNYINEQTNDKNYKKDCHLFNAFKEKTHTKYYNDNSIKKPNAFLFKVLISHVNKILQKFQESENNIESNSLKEKKKKKYDMLVKIRGDLAKNTKLNFTKNLLNKYIKDILSWPISKVRYYKQNHNKEIINKYYKNNDILKKILDTKYEDIIKYINEKDNTFEGLIDTYKEELKKRKDKEDMENMVEQLVVLIKNRKSK